jgi:hypothetical protein
MNISICSPQFTASTNIESALQRAENMYIYGVTNILELCVGPSLKTLESVYNLMGIKCTGNDIESKWQDYYPYGDWLLGDCRVVLGYTHSLFDGIVFAPPLSMGCTGRREDSLRVDQVSPSYIEVLDLLKHIEYKGLVCFILPARATKTSYDRKITYNLLSNINNYDLVELTNHHRNITKYVDVYFKIDHK